MLTENDKEDFVSQADMRELTGQPSAFKEAIGGLKDNRPNYMKDYIKEWNEKHPNYRKEWNRNHPNYKKDYMREWNEKHPNYMKDYLKEWKSRNKEKQRLYREIWNKNHPDYVKDYMKKWSRAHPNYMKDRVKEWKGNMKGIIAGSTLKVEGADLAVVSGPDKSVFRDIDEAMRKDSASEQDGW